ncbi:UPF0182 family protein [Clostridium cellulovorans]|uniref:UPF0182 protein Clocel_0010 n=1 Tax=Clostridium cellulovorans (strain ATCC 35296 / DSM 3052 / OCM 3 / 743B) TaxID=573061 RepID=D9SML6_CLOC7|nr:UPF0182 family protein [Clostridium cellulovorans]ADL49801.1 protein of unknown function UPF0182 [Clostridium cellulovorans 743B]
MAYKNGVLKKFIVPIVVVFFLLVGFFNSIVNLIVNIQWYEEVKYLAIYFTKLKSLAIVTIPLFFVFFILIFLYYKSIRKSFNKSRSAVDTGSNKRNKLVFLVDAVISFFLSISIGNGFWYEILQFVNSTNFNDTDPIFNKDISFYIFKLPLLKGIYQVLLTTLILLIIATVIFYIAVTAYDRLNKTVNNNVINLNKSNIKIISMEIAQFAGKQLASLAALVLLVTSYGYVLKGYEIVYSSAGVVYGASYTDVTITLNFFRAIAIVSFVAAIVVFMSILRKKIKPIAVSVIAIFVLTAIQPLVSTATESIIVKSNQRNLEKKYIGYNIDYTRKAFDINDIKYEEYDVNRNLTAEDINNNRGIIDNIKINSYKPALEFYNQVQSMKYYYDYNDIDIDRYTVDGKFTQVFLGTRELNPASLTQGTNTWEGKHLLYTHGYGVAMSKVNSITESGKPNFIIKDIPMENKSGIKIENPRIYFGEADSNYVIVNTKSGEVDYPEGGENKLNKYDGNGGIKLSFAKKLLYAAYFGSEKILLSNEITADSKIMFNRTITDRINKIAPFLTYDRDPYMVISEGKLYWIIDGYTTSNRYPMSQPYNNINYIRNSVKVVIDAYNGDTNFYISDEKDPLIQTYKKIYPTLFKDLNTLSKDIISHFKYPEDIFDLQSEVLGKYHVTDPDVFFDGSDLWQVSKDDTDVSNNANEAKNTDYQTLKLPKSNKSEMVVINYFNIRNKNNMSSMLVGRMDGENYGDLVAYRFPSNESIYSPALFQKQFKQDAVISKELSLLNTQGSNVNYGDTVIVPMENSLLYIMPLYIRATGENSIPEVKKIVLSNGEKTVMGDNMEVALGLLFGDIKNTEKTDGTEGKNDSNTGNLTLAKQAKDIYNKMIEAQKSGDWSAYGNYQKQLGEIIEQINK